MFVLLIVLLNMVTTFSYFQKRGFFLCVFFLLFLVLFVCLFLFFVCLFVVVFFMDFSKTLLLKYDSTSGTTGTKISIRLKKSCGDKIWSKQAPLSYIDVHELYTMWCSKWMSFTLSYDTCLLMKSKTRETNEKCERDDMLSFYHLIYTWQTEKLYGNERCMEGRKESQGLHWI